MMQFKSLDSYGHWTWTLNGRKPVQFSGFGGTSTSNVEAFKSDKGVFQCPSQAGAQFIFVPWSKLHLSQIKHFIKIITRNQLVLGVQKYAQQCNMLTMQWGSWACGNSDAVGKQDCHGHCNVPHAALNWNFLVRQWILPQLSRSVFEPLSVTLI